MPFSRFLIVIATALLFVFPLSLHARGNKSAVFTPASGGVFRGDTLLREITVASGVASLPPFAFEGCSSLEKVTFESDSLVEIGDYAFLDCVGLKEIVFPMMLNKLREGAFMGCSRLQGVALPPGLKKLPKYAFARCANLEKADLESVSEIGAHAFAYCSALKSVSLSRELATVGNNAFALCTSLRSIAFPASVTELGSYALAGCTALETVVLPANGSLLGELIFSDCTALCEITELSLEVPPFDCNSFIFEPSDSELYSCCQLKTAPGMAEAYRRAPGWSLFRKITE